MPDDTQGQTIPEGTRIADHFVVLRQLGGGGMGEVYLAENMNLEGVKRAIKVLKRGLARDPRFIAMLADEAKRQAKLDHDNIVMILDFVHWEGQYCLIADFVDGQTLESLLEAAPSGMELDQAIALMLDVLSGLDFAHKNGVLHCDVKPANVMVDQNGRARVTDFGISRDISQASVERGIVGTAPYMSPEQILKPNEIDHRTDVFSAGVMFFEMLTGRLPFEQPEAGGAQTFSQLLADAPSIRSLRPEAPEQLARIVTTALQRDPGDRFQGCADFRNAIVDFTRRQRWRKTWLPALGGLAVLSLAGAAGLYEWKAWVDEQTRKKEAQLHQQQLEATKRALDESIANAVKHLKFMCRESAELEAKAPGLRILREMGETKRAEDFKRRLDDMERNINSYATSYQEVVIDMNKRDANLVRNSLETQLSSGPGNKAYLDLIAADHAALQGGGQPMPSAQLVSSCPK